MFTSANKYFNRTDFTNWVDGKTGKQRWVGIEAFERLVNLEGVLVLDDKGFADIDQRAEGSEILIQPTTNAWRFACRMAS